MTDKRCVELPTESAPGVKPGLWAGNGCAAAVQDPMNTAEMSSWEFSLTGKDGWPIACWRWGDCEFSKAIVQIAHGMGEHVGRYANLISVLVSAGFVVYGNDHRGHGRSVPPSHEFGDFGPGGFPLLVEDMYDLTRVAKTQNPNKPLILLGHSMGSFAAQYYVLEHSREIDGLVLSGTGALDELARIAKSTPADNFLNAHFQPARTPFDWLCRNPEVVDAFIEDPLCFASLQPSSMESFLAAGSVLADSSQLRNIRGDLPIYIVSGSDDPVGQQLEGVRILINRYHEAILPHVSHNFYPGGRHEMLNETNHVEVIHNLFAWLFSRSRMHSPRASWTRQKI